MSSASLESINNLNGAGLHLTLSWREQMERDPSIKINLATQTRYKPKEMTDESVYDLARHYYTVAEISAYFNVSDDTVLNLHGEAFREGKQNAMQKPRMMLDRIISDFAALPEGVLARSDIPVNNLLKAIELHAKKYEGLGSKQTIVHESNLSYDKVESKPIVIERPEE